MTPTGIRLIADCIVVDTDEGSIVFQRGIYSRLADATDSQLMNVRFSTDGAHWEELDEDLSLSGLVRDFGLTPDSTEINSHAEYHSALHRIEELWENPRSHELERLVKAVGEFEEANWPIPPPTAKAAAEFRMDQETRTLDDVKQSGVEEEYARWAPAATAMLKAIDKCMRCRCESGISDAYVQLLSVLSQEPPTEAEVKERLFRNPGFLASLTPEQRELALGGPHIFKHDDTDSAERYALGMKRLAEIGSDDESGAEPTDIAFRNFVDEQMKSPEFSARYTEAEASVARVDAAVRALKALDHSPNSEEWGDVMCEFCRWCGGEPGCYCMNCE